MNRYRRDRTVGRYPAPPAVKQRDLFDQASAAMASYTCEQCGMSVNMTCGACGKELVHDTLTKDDGGIIG